MHSRITNFSFGYRCVAVLLCVGLCDLPMLAAANRPLGTIAEAENAHLDGASAVTGTTIYAGDAIDTESPGALRLRLANGQLYFSGASSATLSEHSGIAAANLVHGTASFSIPDSTQFELETPAGILRGSGRNFIRGQVAVNNPHELIVWAIRGDLILDNDGELHTIAEGKTFRIAIEEDSASPPSDDSPQTRRRKRKKLIFLLIFGGVLVGTSAILWHHASESNSDPN